MLNVTCRQPKPKLPSRTKLERSNGACAMLQAGSTAVLWQTLLEKARHAWGKAMAWLSNLAGQSIITRNKKLISYKLLSTFSIVEDRSPEIEDREISRIFGCLSVHGQLTVEPWAVAAPLGKTAQLQKKRKTTTKCHSLNEHIDQKKHTKTFFF